MAQTQILSPWFRENRSDWEVDVHAWLIEASKACNLGRMVSSTTLKERPWSLVRQVEFEHDTTFFKACGARSTFEPQLLLFLGEHGIDFGPEILSVELNHHWLLMADGGPRLREADTNMDLAEQLCAVLSSYAKMQIASIGWVDELVGFGLPDRRMNQVPDLLETLLADDVIGTGHSVEDVAKLRLAAKQLLPKLKSVCAMLNQTPFSNGLDHGDLHTANILMSGGHVSLIDWGDACITHPFCSLSVTVEAMLNQIPIEERTTWLEKMRDAYLRPWSKIYPNEKLLVDFDRALWVGQAARALDYAYMFTGADEATLNQWRATIFGQLDRWINFRSKYIMRGKHDAQSWNVDLL